MPAMKRQLTQCLQQFIDEGNEATDEEHAISWLRARFSEYARLPMATLRKSVRSVMPSVSAATEPHAESQATAVKEAGTHTKVHSYSDDHTAEPRRKRKRSAASSPSQQVPASEQQLASSASVPQGPGLSSLGGINEQAHVLTEAVLRPLMHPEVYAFVGVNPPRGVLLHGPAGTGKTRLAHAVAYDGWQHANASFFCVSAPELVAGVAGESEQRLRSLFQRASAHAPAIVFIDEIDALAPKRESAQREMERRVVAQLLTSMDSAQPQQQQPDEQTQNSEAGGPDIMTPAKDQHLQSSMPHVSVIAATNRPDGLDPALRRAGRFDREVLVGVPSVQCRVDMLSKCLDDVRLAYSPDIKALARRTPGYVAADLSALVQEAASSAVARAFAELGIDPSNWLHSTASQAREEVGGTDVLHEPQSIDYDHASTGGSTYLSEEALLAAGACVLEEDLEKALASVQPSATREGFATVPDVEWSHVGALEGVREELQRAIAGPINEPERYSRLGLLTACGVLLHGPPGCGKTLVAKAAANEALANFISVRGPEMLNKYVGESEKAVREMFARARAASPAILFFDELDALAPRRGTDSSGAAERVVNQLLTELDGLESRRQVFVIAATNRPDMVDAAMLRPGRLDKLLYIGLPDANARLSILHTMCSNLPLQDDVDLTAVANDTRADGVSGADLSSLIRDAGVSALKAGRDNISQSDVETALETIVPSVSRSASARYERLKSSLRSARSHRPEHVDPDADAAE